MKLVQRIGKIPDGNTPFANQQVAVRRVSDGSTIATPMTDTQGFVTLLRDGHLDPFYLHLAEVPGGDKYWRSDEVKTAGVVAPKELPAVLTAIGEGVLAGYGGEFAVSLISGGPSFSVATGASLVAGHPYVTYGSTTFSPVRPPSGTRVDRLVIRYFPEGSSTTPGKADLALITGVVDAGPPALQQDAYVYEQPLFAFSIPSSGTITTADQRPYGGGRPPVRGESRATVSTTTSASGSALAAVSPVALYLPRKTTYDIAAQFTAVQNPIQAGWALQSAIPLSGTTDLARMAADSSGNVYVAHIVTGSAVFKISTSGVPSTFVVPSITGTPMAVSLDTSNNVYVGYLDESSNNGMLKKYNSAATLLWTKTIGAFSYVSDLSTDGTNLYAVMNNGSIKSFLCADGSNGSTNFNPSASASGICMSGSNLMVVCRSPDEVRVYTTGGTLVTFYNGVSLNNASQIAKMASNFAIADTGGTRVVIMSSAGAFVTGFAVADVIGVTVTAGDIIYASHGSTVEKWDETAGGGHGEIAIDIDSTLSSYVGVGNQVAGVVNAHVGTASGPGTVNVTAYGKATSGQMSLQSIVLSATATPRG